MSQVSQPHDMDKGEYVEWITFYEEFPWAMKNVLTRMATCF